MSFKFISMGRIAELETDGVRFVFGRNEDSCGKEFSLELHFCFFTIDSEREDFDVSFWSLKVLVVCFLKSNSFVDSNEVVFEVIDSNHSFVLEGQEVRDRFFI